MNVDLSTVFITRYEIPRFGILQLYVSVPSLLQELPKLRNIFLLNRYVQVTMRAGLLTKECIDAPTAIDPDFDAQLFKGGIQINDINGVHACHSPTERRKTKANLTHRTARAYLTAAERNEV